MENWDWMRWKINIKSNKQKQHIQVNKKYVHELNGLY
jgi:hypothetical protein